MCVLSLCRWKAEGMFEIFVSKVSPVRVQLWSVKIDMHGLRAVTLNKLKAQHHNGHTRGRGNASTTSLER